MAKTASKEAVTRADNPPEYGKANDIIHEILGKKQNSSVISGKISADYKRITDLRVDAAAARMMTNLWKQEPENRAVTLRSLFGMIEAAGDDFEVPKDLVDMMNGKDPKPKPDNVIKLTGKAKAVAEGAEIAGEGDSEEEAEEADLEQEEEDEFDAADPAKAHAQIPDALDDPKGSA